MNVKKIHWLGVGLSSPPGILYLFNKGYKLEVWNRTPEKASRLLSNKIKVRKLDLNDFKKSIELVEKKKLKSICGFKEVDTHPLNTWYLKKNKPFQFVSVFEKRAFFFARTGIFFPSPVGGLEVLFLAAGILA